MIPSGPEYPLFVLPAELVGRPPRDWTKREAKSYFDWLTSSVDGRVAGLLRYLEDDGGGTPEELLLRAGEKAALLLRSDAFSRPSQPGVTTIQKHGRTLQLPVPAGRDLTGQGYSLAIDMGLLTAKCILDSGRAPFVWRIGGKPKTLVGYNVPVLTRSDIAHYLYFDPVESSVMGSQLVAGQRDSERSWYETYVAAFDESRRHS